MPTLQDFPPAAARLCLNAERFAAQDLGADLQDATVVVALSGGSDSTALLRILHALAPRLDLALHAAHLDHGLRPESPADADFCSALCAKLNIPLTVERRDVAALAAERSLGLEDAGRQARYELLERVRRETKATWMALGHTLDDLAEDQLMRLVRGTGWPELAGMEAVDPQRRLLRPLLLTPKHELREFLSSIGQGWCEDATNQERDFRRNRLRADVLPLLAAENPNYLQCAARLWTMARQDRSHLAQLTDLLTQTSDGILLPREAAQDLPPSLRLKLYKAALERLGPGQALAANLLNLERAFTCKHSGSVVQFPGNKTARVRADGILFSPSADA